MKRNPERPGLGFQSKSTLNPQPKTAPSLFGLISQVNKGTLKPEKTEAEKAFGEAEKAAKDIAEKLAFQNSIQKSQHLIDKRNQFLTAKANVERLFKGGGVTSQQQPQTQRPQTTGGVIPQQSQTQKPPLATSGNVFKVPPPKVTDTRQAKASASEGRPGLGFEENTGKKYFPKVDVGVGRNLFSEEENKTKQGKFSLVPYSYDKEGDEKSRSTSSRSRLSSSSSKGGRKFTEEKRKSDSRDREKNSREKSSRSSRDTSSKHDKDDYLKYGYGKDGPVPSVKDLSYHRSGSDFGNSNTDTDDYVGGFQDYGKNPQYKVGTVTCAIGGDMDLSSRNENDVLRFMNEINVERRSPDHDEYNKNNRSHERPQSSDYLQQDIREPPLAAPFTHPVDVDFGVPPPGFDSSGQPMFIPAVPINLVPLPLGPVDMGGSGDNYHGDRGGYEPHHYGDDGNSPVRGDDGGSYGMIDNFGNYGVPVYDSTVQGNVSEFGYEQDYYDESFGGDGYNRSPGRFGDDPYNQMGDNYYSGSEYSDYGRRSPRSLSPDGYYSPDRNRSGRDGRRDRRSRSFDRSRDSRSRSPRRKSKYPRKDSGWYNVDPDDQERLSFLESKMGYSTRPRSRDRSLDRSSSVERFRGRSPLPRSRSRSPGLRSRSRSRSRGNRSLSRGRRDSRRRRSRGDSRGSPRSAHRAEESVGDQVRVAEDPFVVGQRAYLEAREQQWENIKMTFNLTDANKAQHPMFAGGLDEGYFCQDCSVTCMKSEEYGQHLLSDNHLRVVQLKAQELMMKELSSAGSKPEDGNRQRKSRFTDIGEPRTSTVSAKTDDRSGVPGSRRDRSRDRRDRREGSRSRDRRRRSRSRDRKQRSHSRDRKKERERRHGVDDEDLPAPVGSNEIVPEKPKGPLKVENIKATSLQLFWYRNFFSRTRTNTKYLVEYCVFNTMQGKWRPLGITFDCNFVVRALQEDTGYMFQVKSVRKDVESLPIISARVRTRISEETKEKAQEKAKSLAKEAAATKDVIDLTEDKREAGKDRETKKRDHTTEEIKEAERMMKEVKKQEEEEKKKQEEERKKRERERKKREEEMKEKERLAEEERRKPKIQFYEKIKLKENENLIGLEYIHEVQNYNPNIESKYTCKLCNCSLTFKALMSHLKGQPHKMKYFEKNDPSTYEKLMLIWDKKERKALTEKHCTIILCEKGWGAMKLVRMENPLDHNLRIVYSKPISIPMPDSVKPSIKVPSLSDVEKQVSDALKDQKGAKYTEDGQLIIQFEKLLQDEEVERIKEGQKVEPVLGLQFIKELLHPKNKEQPRYHCSVCKANCAQKNILQHIWGRNHRLTYMKFKHEEIYNKINKIQDKQEKNDAIDNHSQEIEEKFRRGEVITLRSRNSFLWDWAKKEREKAEKIKAEKEAQKESEKAAASGASNVSSTSNVIGNTEPVKFGVKAKEQPTTNVQKANVLEELNKGPTKKQEKDWHIENAAILERMKNQSIIKCSRKPKFNTTYSAFFKKFPVIGLQWVTEYQKPDKDAEPWYMCFLCLSKVEWKSILDHVTSVQHRLSYLKRSYTNMYTLLLRTTKNNRVNLKNKVEDYALKISTAEGEQHNMEVMLELNFKKSLLADSKEKSKSGATAATVSAQSKPKSTAASVAQGTAFSTGLSSEIDNTPAEKDKSSSVTDNTLSVTNNTLSAIPDSTVGQPKFRSKEEEALYKAQLEAQAKLSQEFDQTGQQKPAKSELLKAQPEAKSRLSNTASEDDLIKAQLQAQAELTGQTVVQQPVGPPRGFSTEQILPGMPVLQSQTMPMRTAMPIVSVPSETQANILQPSTGLSIVAPAPNIPVDAPLPSLQLPSGQVLQPPPGPIIPPPPGFLRPPAGPFVPPPPGLFGPQVVTGPLGPPAAQPYSSTVASAPQQFGPPSGQPYTSTVASAPQEFGQSSGQPYASTVASAPQQFGPPSGQAYTSTVASAPQEFGQSSGQPYTSTVASAPQQFSLPSVQPYTSAMASAPQQFGPPSVQPFSSAVASAQAPLGPPSVQPYTSTVASAPQQLGPPSFQPYTSVASAQEPLGPPSVQPYTSTVASAPQQSWEDGVGMGQSSVVQPNNMAEGPGTAVLPGGSMMDVGISNTESQATLQQETDVNDIAELKPNTRSIRYDNENTSNKTLDSFSQNIKGDRDEAISSRRMEGLNRVKESQESTRFSHNARADKYSSGDNVHGAKRKDSRSRSPESYKRFRKEDSRQDRFHKRRSESLERKVSRSPASRDGSRGSRDNADDRQRSRSDQRRRGMSPETKSRPLRREERHEDRDRFDIIPEDGERIVRRISPKGSPVMFDFHVDRERDRGRYDANQSVEYINDFEERYNRQFENDIDEFVTEDFEKLASEADHEIGDLESMERQMLEADLELGQLSDRDRDDYRDRKRKYDRESGYSDRNEQDFHSSRQHARRRSRSPPFRKQYDDGKSGQHIAGRAQDRYGDGQRSRIRVRKGNVGQCSRQEEESEVSGRSSPTQQQIQELLAQVSSRMKEMPEEDRQMMEEELRRNLPQVSLPSQEEDLDDQDLQYPHQDERTGRDWPSRPGRGRAARPGRGGPGKPGRGGPGKPGRGGAERPGRGGPGPRGRGSRGTFGGRGRGNNPQRGRGFQKRGR